MEELDLVKWWGAVLATMAFSWNVYNSFSNAPKIKATLRPDTTYPDARVISTEMKEYGESKELALYCHIEITNIGRFPATVTNIELTHSVSRGRKASYSADRFISLTPQNIPVLISPGSLWSCRLEMDDIYFMAKRGKPEIHIIVSYRDKPIVIIPKFETNKSQMNDT